MSDQALHLTEGTFDSELGKHKEVMMVDFWAEWCAPCRAIAPTLDELAAETSNHVSADSVWDGDEVEYALTKADWERW